jgi:hypothetical protein
MSIADEILFREAELVTLKFAHLMVVDRRMANNVEPFLSCYSRSLDICSDAEPHMELTTSTMG